MFVGCGSTGPGEIPVVGGGERPLEVIDQSAVAIRHSHRATALTRRGDARSRPSSSDRAGWKWDAPLRPPSWRCL
jgi:hypothetical protein